MLHPLEELLIMIIEIPRKYGRSMYRNICMMALIQSPYLINEVNHSPHILGSMRTVPSIDFIWVYLQYCSAISWWVNWNLSNRTPYSNSFFSQHHVHANSSWGETQGRGETSSPEVWTHLITGMANTIFMSTKFAAGRQSQNWFNLPVFLPRRGACALQGCFGWLPSKNLFAVFTVSAVCVNKGLL